MYKISLKRLKDEKIRNFKTAKAHGLPNFSQKVNTFHQNFSFLDKGMCK